MGSFQNPNGPNQERKLTSNPSSCGKGENGGSWGEAQTHTESCGGGCRQRGGGLGAHGAAPSLNPTQRVGLEPQGPLDPEPHSSTEKPHLFLWLFQPHPSQLIIKQLVKRRSHFPPVKLLLISSLSPRLARLPAATPSR